MGVIYVLLNPVKTSTLLTVETLTNLRGHVAGEIFKWSDRLLPQGAGLTVEDVSGQSVVSAALHVDRDQVDAALVVVEQVFSHLTRLSFKVMENLSFPSYYFIISLSITIFSQTGKFYAFLN